MPKNWNKTVSIQEAKAAYAVGDDLGAYCFLYEGDRVRPVRITLSGDIVTLPPYVPPATLYTKTDRFIDNLIADIEPVQSGTGDPSPDNIRPISGWDGLKLTRTAKNIFGGITMGQAIVDAVNVPSNTYLGSDENGDYVTFSAGTALSNKVVFTQFKPNTQYTIILKCKKENINSNNLNIGVGYTDGTDESFRANTPAELQTKAFVTQAGKSILYLKMSYGSSRTFLYYNESGIFEGVLTADDFVPYDGQTYPITFPSEAGTVYGGTLDVTTGVLTVTDAQIASYNGEALPSTWISDRDIYAEGTTPTTGAQVVYKLGTPQNYQLTPTEVKTLLKQNNIFADTGPIILTYVETQEV